MGDENFTVQNLQINCLAILTSLLIFTIIVNTVENRLTGLIVAVYHSNNQNSG